MDYYLLKEKNERMYYSLTTILDDKGLKALNHPIRKKMLLLLKEKPMYPAELAKKLDMHEQKIYYHLNQLASQNIVEIVEKKEIRGTIAKKYSPKEISFSYSLANNWNELNELIKKKETKITQFLTPFIKKGKLNCNIIVGSPDPHGPHKARARDGHYAIDLALFLGKFCTLEKDFTVKLDVDADLNQNLIVVGGPVTNLINAKINEYLPVKFSDKKPWGLTNRRNEYTDDTIGFISRIDNPFFKDKKIIVIAGIRFIGTKAAIIALTRHTKQVLNRFTNQREFSCIVQGFDLDGDGRIDSVEVVE